MISLSAEWLEDAARRYPICDYRFGWAAALPFSERVRAVCENDCPRYGRCWACPPYCGTVAAGRARCLSHRRFFLFSTVHEVADAWDMEACLLVKREHEALTRALHSELWALGADALVLSTGCTLCDVCACPDAPCRFPSERLCSLESHGIVLVRLCEEVGLGMDLGPGTVSYFSLVLFERTKTAGNLA